MKALVFVSSAIVPAVLALCGVLILFSKKPLFDAFIRGAKRGMETAVGLFPTLVALFCMISMLGASGIPEMIAEIFGGGNSFLPDGISAFLLMRPVSGAASTALLSDIFANQGPDSAAGLAASVMLASSDTLVYVVSVYTSAAGIKKSRCTIPAAIITAVISAFGAIVICGKMFC